MSRASLISIVDNKSHKTELISFKRDMITEAQTLKAKSIEIQKTLNFTKCKSHQVIIKCDQQQHRYIVSFDR